MGPISPKKWAGAPNFRPMYCGETAGWIKMALDTEVGLGPGQIVSDGDPAHPPQKEHTPQFSAHVCCGGWMDQDVTWYEGRR